MACTTLCCYHHSAHLHLENCIVCPTLTTAAAQAQRQMRNKMYNGISSYENYTNKARELSLQPPPTTKIKKKKKKKRKSFRPFQFVHSQNPPLPDMRVNYADMHACRGLFSRRRFVQRAHAMLFSFGCKKCLRMLHLTSLLRCSFSPCRVCTCSEKFHGHHFMRL